MSEHLTNVAAKDDGRWWGTLSDEANAKGHTPLLVAAHHGRAEMVKMLLQHRADVHKGRSGLTPLKTATDNKHFEVVQLLQSSGRL